MTPLGSSNVDIPLASHHNPYQAPLQVATSVRHSAADATKLRWLFLITRPIVFGLNMIVPLFFGWMIAETGGLVGMLAGVAVLFVSGWGICHYRPSLARKVIWGGAILS